MMRFARRLLICALAAAGGCGSPGGTDTGTAPHGATPEVPAEIQAVAATVLGSGAAVLAFGDLAHNGRQQALVANRLGDAREGAEPGTRFTRAAIVEQQGTKWSEVLRCDEYLKNSQGYLGGIPLVPITGWRIEFGEGTNYKGKEFLFTPVRAPGETSMPTITVQWNPSVKRYQSLDRENGRFFSEVASLETPASPLR